MAVAESGFCVDCKTVAHPPVDGARATHPLCVGPLDAGQPRREILADFSRGKFHGYISYFGYSFGAVREGPAGGGDSSHCRFLGLNQFLRPLAYWQSSRVHLSLSQQSRCWLAMNSSAVNFSASGSGFTMAASLVSASATEHLRSGGCRSCNSMAVFRSRDVRLFGSCNPLWLPLRFPISGDCNSKSSPTTPSSDTDTDTEGKRDGERDGERDDCATISRFSGLETPFSAHSP